MEEVPEDLELLEKAIAQRNYENVYQLAHKIKPNVDLLGMEHARATALEIETLGKSAANSEKIEELFHRLKKDIQQVVTELQNDYNL